MVPRKKLKIWLKNHLEKRCSNKIRHGTEEFKLEKIRNKNSSGFLPKEFLNSEKTEIISLIRPALFQ